LSGWDGVLVNDYLAMLFRDALASALGDRTGARVNDLLSGLGRVATAEAALAAEGLAARAAASPRLAAALGGGEAGGGRAAGAADFSASWAGYLEMFGDAAEEELKFECPTVSDDPLPHLRRIGLRAQALLRGEGPTGTGTRPPCQRWPEGWWRRPWLLWVLRQ